MEGIQYIVNRKGEKTAVLMDIRKHADLWEDVYDALLAEKRKHEPRESLESVRRSLQKQGKLKKHA